MDDFGTGYSSLSYLRNFPFDKIKIDRCFISGLSEDNNSLAIVKAVSDLATSLRMTTTAEGVETQEQLEAIQHLGCGEFRAICSVLQSPLRTCCGCCSRPAKSPPARLSAR